jgi:hypothetical protein
MQLLAEAQETAVRKVALFTFGLGTIVHFGAATAGDEAKAIAAMAITSTVLVARRKRPTMPDPQSSTRVTLSV